MYDLAWARHQLEAYEKCTPRVTQMYMVVQQLCLSEASIPWFTKEKTRVALIYAIRDKHYGTVWRKWKRLVRKTPFDVELARVVSSNLVSCYCFAVDDSRQFLLEFEPETT